jgi:hypothetical protein
MKPVITKTLWKKCEGIFPVKMSQERMIAGHEKKVKEIKIAVRTKSRHKDCRAIDKHSASGISAFNRINRNDQEGY